MKKYGIYNELESNPFLAKYKITEHAYFIKQLFYGKLLKIINNRVYS